MLLLELGDGRYLRYFLSAMIVPGLAHPPIVGYRLGTSQERNNACLLCVSRSCNSPFQLYLLMSSDPKIDSVLLSDGRNHAPAAVDICLSPFSSLP